MKNKVGARLERMKNTQSSERQEMMEQLKKYPLGFYILIVGGLWAIIEFIMSILYFF